MKLEELRDRVNELHLLLQDPQPGLMSWSMMLVEQMTELVAHWQGTDKKSASDVIYS